MTIIDSAPITYNVLNRKSASLLQSHKQAVAFQALVQQEAELEGEVEAMAYRLEDEAARQHQSAAALGPSSARAQKVAW